MNNLFRIIAFIAITISTSYSFGLNNSSMLHKTTEPIPFTIETLGEGKPIFFLPGFATPGSIWKETVENVTLERKSYLVSYAGFNGVQPIEMPWYSSIKNGIIAYIKESNLTDIIIVGHSMGGNLAVDIASELPNKVSKIIIVEALPCMRDVMMPGVPADSFYYSSPYNQQILDMDEQQFSNMAGMMASNMTNNTSKQDLLSHWMIASDRKTWVYGYTDLLKLDLRNALTHITCETLIIGASFPDVDIAKGNYEAQYANLSNKTILMATNSKHFVMFDQPEWFYNTVNDFLENEAE